MVEDGQEGGRTSGPESSGETTEASTLLTIRQVDVFVENETPSIPMCPVPNAGGVNPMYGKRGTEKCTNEMETVECEQLAGRSKVPDSTSNHARQVDDVGRPMTPEVHDFCRSFLIAVWVYWIQLFHDIARDINTAGVPPHGRSD